VSRRSIFAASSDRNRPILASVSVLRLMRAYRRAPGRTALVEGIQRLERPARLTTGLILFAFATSHLLNHALGIRSIAAMQDASAVLLAPWQTQIGASVLYSSFLVHALLGLYALHRRRHLRIPAGEAWQLALGLTIPFLLITHAAGIRFGEFQYARESGYGPILYKFWVVSPDFALPWQLLLLVVAWIHGCIGLRSWLRTKRWYFRLTGLLASLATLVPVLAILGVVNAGLNLRDAVLRDPSTASSFAPLPDSEDAKKAASAIRISEGMTVIYVVLAIGIFGLRAARTWQAKRLHGIRISYPGGHVVSVSRGFSILEASRWAGLPHASVCGGRGRCSTCKVRIVEGAKWLDKPGPVERLTLRRIAAPPTVRLACQLRPSADLSVEPLVATGTGFASASRFDAAIAGGQELQIAAMFVDLRESTRLATGRLPFDALFLFDRYIQVVTGAIRRNRGHATSIAGDGVMSVFGVEGTAEAAARGALQAALEVWNGVDALSRELAGELEAPLRIGIGIHAGTAVVGLLRTGETQALQFLGDTGNVAAKLEAKSKDLGCTIVVSLAALNWVVRHANWVERRLVAIPGKSDVIEIAAFKDMSELERLLAASSS
jgi:adenylate cyclase